MVDFTTLHPFDFVRNLFNFFNSYAIRSQSVMTTNSTGRVYNVQHCTAHERDSATEHSLLTHNFFRHALLSCSEILTYQFLGSQVLIFMSTENSRSPATAIDREVSKSRHNSRTKLHIQVSYVEKRDNIEFYCIAGFRAHRSACAAKLK